MNDNQNLFSLSIDPVTKSYLTDIYKWTKFLAITGMVVLILGLIAVIIGTTVSADVFTSRSADTVTEMTPAVRATMAIVSVIAIAVAFFPLYFLLQFSNKMKRALVSNNQEELNESFARLKTYFKYLGIITLIALCFYALAIVLRIVGNSMS
jgi:hypothetical protein